MSKKKVLITAIALLTSHFALAAQSNSACPDVEMGTYKCSFVETLNGVTKPTQTTVLTIGKYSDDGDPHLALDLKTENGGETDVACANSDGLPNNISQMSSSSTKSSKAGASGSFTSKGVNDWPDLMTGSYDLKVKSKTSLTWKTKADAIYKDHRKPDIHGDITAECSK